MASGISRTYSGAVIGTGAELTVAQVGFRPKLVLLINPADGSFAFHIDSMAADSAVKQKGSATTALSTTAVTLADNGFVLKADTDLNVAGETLHFICFE